MGAKAIWREDLVTSLLSILLVAGLFLDGWNHISLRMTDFLTFAGVDPATRHAHKRSLA